MYSAALKMVFTRCASFRAPIWCPSGGGGTQEAGATVAKNMAGRTSTSKCTVARTRFGEGGGPSNIDKPVEC